MRRKTIKPSFNQSRIHANKQAARPTPYVVEGLAKEYARRFPKTVHLLKKFPIKNVVVLRVAAQELLLAQSEMNGSNDRSKIWHHLERAHILVQRSAISHGMIHVMFFCYAVYTKDWKECFGQLPRLILAVPSSLFCFAPTGNNGRVTMGLFQKGKVPKDLIKYVNIFQK